MSARKQILTEFGNAIQKVTRIAYSNVLKPLASHAGRELQKGNGGFMRTYNRINRNIKKM